jgi:SPP1 gp7 family putative phage head morphogenesis protein
MSYWANRLANAQAAITEKSLKQIEKQFAKYYAATSKRVIREFENTYNKVLAQQEEGKQVTPADLYKLDKYWSMQGQLRQEMQKLGEKQVSLLTKVFEINFFEVYYSLNIEGLKAFTTIDKSAVKQMINSIWVADGKTFSQRVWENTSRLLETLNEELISCVVAGKKTTQLKNALMERFGVSYRRADTLARTELCHIQTQAAQQRYKDYGIEEVEVLVDPDERTCELCNSRNNQLYDIKDVPLDHPNGICTTIPEITMSYEEIGKELKAWVNGEANAKLDKWFKKHGKEFI